MPDPPDLPPAPPPVTRREAFLLAALTLAAGAARLIALDRVPPGLHVDEAFNLIDARAVLAGWRPIYLPANAGRDVLYTYLQAPLLALFGDRIAVARAASALIGTLTVPLVWWAVRTIMPPAGPTDGSGDDATTDVLPEARPDAMPDAMPDASAAARIRRTALTAAALLAVLYWHVHFSRFGIRAILLPAFVAAFLARWWPAATAAEPHRRRRAAFDAGILLGLAAYAHPAGRGLVVLPLAHALWRGRRHRRHDAAVWRALALSVLTGLAVAAPLILTWLVHPWQATGHAAEVSILGRGAGALAANTARVAGLFVVRGDGAMWRNLPGRPAFDVISGAAFVVGVALAARAAWRGHGWAVLALLVLVGLALPSALTDSAPNFSRSIGVLPAAVWLAAVGAVAAGDAVARRAAPAWRRRAAVLVPALVVAAAAAATARDYTAWAGDGAARVAFDADIAAFARWTDGLPDDHNRFTSPETADHATFRAAARGRLPGVDARYGLVVPLAAGTGRGQARYMDLARLPWAAAQSAALAEWSAVRMPHIAVGTTLGPIAAVPAGVGALNGAVVRLDASRALRSASRPPHFDARITYLDASLPARIVAGTTVSVTLAWLASGPTGHSLSTAVQLNTPSGRGLANGDGLPAGGSYPTDRWRAGEVVLSRHALRVPEDAPVGPAVLRVGWYILTYPDGPTAPPHVNPITDDQGRDIVGVANTQIVAPAPAGGGSGSG